jgi:hypothetical protein
MAAKTIAVLCVAAAISSPVISAFPPPGIPGMTSCARWVSPSHLETTLSMHDIETCSPGWRARYDATTHRWEAVPPRPGEHLAKRLICGRGLVSTRVFQW